MSFICPPVQCDYTVVGFQRRTAYSATSCCICPTHFTWYRAVTVLGSDICFCSRASWSPPLSALLAAPYCIAGKRHPRSRRRHFALYSLCRSAAACRGKKRTPRMGCCTRKSIGCRNEKVHLSDCLRNRLSLPVNVFRSLRRAESGKSRRAFHQRQN